MNQNIGTVTAYTDRLGKTTSTAGSIGNITATTGQIDGEINGFKGLGNITAGTSILQSITAAGAGANAANIRAGAYTAGSITGAIFVNGNIKSVIATAVSDSDLPTGAGTAVTWNVTLRADGTLVKPERMKLATFTAYTEGNITGGIIAGGGVFDVMAHGSIEKPIAAGAELPRILAYKKIKSDLTAGKGGSSITTYGDLKGDVSIPGSTTIWAYDDISGTMNISAGGLTASTWGSFLSTGGTQANAAAFGNDAEADAAVVVNGTEARDAVVVNAYNEINATGIRSRESSTTTNANDSIKAAISASLHATVNAGGSVWGSVISDKLSDYLKAAGDWNATVQSGMDINARVGKTLRAKLEAKGVERIIAENGEDAELKGDSVFAYVRDAITGTDIIARKGNVLVEAQIIASTRVIAKGSWLDGNGAVFLEGYSFVHMSVEADSDVGLYAHGDMEFVHSTSFGSQRVFALNGIDGTFKTQASGFAPGITAVSWNGAVGTFESLTGNVVLSGYGDSNVKIDAKRNATVSMWGNVRNEITAGSVTVFARNDVSATIISNGTDPGTISPTDPLTVQSILSLETAITGRVDVFAGGNISGHVATSREVVPGSAVTPVNWNRDVTLIALGDVTGGADAMNDIVVFGNNLKGRYDTLYGSEKAYAVRTVDAKFKAAYNIAVHAGESITSGAGDGATASAAPPAPPEAGITSTSGSVTLSTFGLIKEVSASAAQSITAIAATEITSFAGNAGSDSSLTSFGTISLATLTSTAGNVTAFAGESASLTITADKGDVTAVAMGDVAGTFTASLGDVTVVAFGLANGVTGNGGEVHVFGYTGANVTLIGRTTASAESANAVSGSLNAPSAAVLAGHESSATLESGIASTVVAGHVVSGSVKSNGTATAVSESRGSVEGGISAIVEGVLGATSVTLGGSVSGLVKSTEGEALAFAGKDISSPMVQGKTKSTAVAIGNITGGEVKATGPAIAAAFGNIGSSVTSEGAYSLVIAGDDVTGAVKANKNAVVVSVSGIVSGVVESTGASSLVIAMDGISGTVKGDRHAIALSYGSVSKDVTATKGSALVVTLAGGVSGEVKATEGYAVVLAFESVSKPVTAGKSILIASLSDVTGLVDAGEYAIVLAGGGVTGSSVTAGRSVLVASLGDVTSSVTAEDGSVLILTLGSVINTVSATAIVAIIAAGDVKVSVPQSQDLIVINGGAREFKRQPLPGQTSGSTSSANSSDSGPAASASRDMVLVGLGSVKGNVSSGRDAVLVSMGSSSANVTAGGDAILFAFDGIQRTDEDHIPTVSGGGDAVVISGASALVHVTGGKNAVLVSLGSASDSIVSGSEFAAVMTYGAGTNLSVTGDKGAFAWTYGDFSGEATSIAGSAVVASIGNTYDAMVHGKDDAMAVTVGSFSGTVTADEEYAGIISLLNASGSLHAGKGALVISDGTVNLSATAAEDLFIWARGDVQGTYAAGRDAAVVSHGTYNASLQADNDIVFAYGGNGLQGSLTAGRWIGDGSTSAPLDPTVIDDVFSHGAILAELLAGTAASTDPNKGRIGTIGAIGNAGGVYSASSINRIRSGGTVTAHYQTAGFDSASGSSTSSGSTVIQENQTTLITNVPRPLLDPSERDAILTEAAAGKASVLADRAETVQAIVDERQAIQDDKQAQLSELSKAREDILREEDALQILVNQAVDAAQRLAELLLAGTRQVIELQYRARDAEYRTLQQVYETVRDQKREEFNELQKDALSLYAKALKAVQQADTKAYQQKLVQEAATRDYLLAYNARWLEAYNKDADERLTAQLDKIQGYLGWAGFVPTPVGVIADLLNATISLTRGNFGDAALYSVAAIPLLGDSVKGGKTLAKAAKHGDEASSLALKMAKNSDYADEVIGAAAKATDSPIVRLMDDAAEAAKNGGCFLPGQFVADLEAPNADFCAALAAADMTDAEREHMKAWLIVLIAAGFVVAALQLEKRRLIRNLAGPVAPQPFLLDEFFSSETPWEPQSPNDRHGELVVT